MKHLKHTLAFHPSSGRRRAERGTVGSGQLAALDGGTTWQRPIVHAPSLGPGSDSPLSCTAVGERGGEGGRQPPVLGCDGDGGWRRVLWRHRVRHRGEEWRWGIEKGRRECRLGGRCGHHGCGDEKKLLNEARRKRNAFIIYF